MYTEIHYKDDECIYFGSGPRRFKYLISFQMKITWLEGKSLHKGSPRIQRPMNVDRGVRGTDTEIFLKTNLNFLSDRFLDSFFNLT